MLITRSRILIDIKIFRTDSFGLDTKKIKQIDKEIQVIFNCERVLNCHID